MLLKRSKNSLKAMRKSISKDDDKTRFEIAETRFQNAETSKTRLLLARNWMDFPIMISCFPHCFSRRVYLPVHCEDETPAGCHSSRQPGGQRCLGRSLQLHRGVRCRPRLPIRSTGQQQTSLHSQDRRGGRRNHRSGH